MIYEYFNSIFEVVNSTFKSRHMGLWGRNKLARVEEEEIVMFSYRVNLAKKLQQIRD